MKQITAVEWLVKQLEKQKDILKNNFEAGKWNDDRCSEIDNCILFCEKAKEIEKSQIVDAYYRGEQNNIEKELTGLPEYQDGYEYYKITYGQ
jgi:hypothetical protein